MFDWGSKHACEDDVSESFSPENKCDRVFLPDLFMFKKIFTF